VTYHDFLAKPNQFFRYGVENKNLGMEGTTKEITVRGNGYNTIDVTTDSKNIHKQKRSSFPHNRLFLK
jgi:hypothetical protein